MFFVFFLHILVWMSQGSVHEPDLCLIDGGLATGTGTISSVVLIRSNVTLQPYLTWDDDCYRSFISFGLPDPYRVNQVPDPIQSSRLP